ncbi:hypothetical protein GCM10011348_07300 [Marinobacterium nitratireducens]|uniref:Uncharacterized protein n=2 Tax=Marinobacterium nitratireducens TaxID=518897 RepID=A0A917Z8C5_9GAMM|nr:hypothetical protein GCM10011348_07300 [Marinobacterium nitratireducens]
MLIVLTLALVVQLAQTRLHPGAAGPMVDMGLSMTSHCDGCTDASQSADCADGLCSGVAAMAIAEEVAAIAAPEHAERAQIPRFHPGLRAAPDPQPPRLSLTV